MISKGEMDLFFSYFIYFILFSVSLAVILLSSRLKSSGSKLPPGRKRWPVIGESLEFALAARRGNPERFITDRMNKYSKEIFRTSLMGENMAVICGASGNKFLFSGEDKIVTSWWPNFVKKIFSDPSTGDHTRPHKVLAEFLKPEGLKQYVEIMDMMAKKQIEMDWTENRELKVKVYPLSRKYTFALSCRLFMNLEDPESVSRMSDGFDRILAGFVSLPVDIPGTTFNNALKARSILHGEISEIIRKRKKEWEEKRDLYLGARDLLSRLLLVSDENGKVLSETEVSIQISGAFLASHETTSTAITFVLKYLAELPHVYDAVFKGNLVINLPHFMILNLWFLIFLLECYNLCCI